MNLQKKSGETYADFSKRIRKISCVIDENDKNKIRNRFVSDNLIDFDRIIISLDLRLRDYLLHSYEQGFPLSQDLEELRRMAARMDDLDRALGAFEGRVAGALEIAFSNADTNSLQELRHQLRSGYEVIMDWREGLMDSHASGSPLRLTPGTQPNIALHELVSGLAHLYRDLTGKEPGVATQDNSKNAAAVNAWKGDFFEFCKLSISCVAPPPDDGTIGRKINEIIRIQKRM